MIFNTATRRISMITILLAVCAIGATIAPAAETPEAADVIKKFSAGNLSGGFRGILDADSDLVKNASQFLLAGVGNLPGFGGARELEAMKKG